MKKSAKKRIVVAMSGGVDSSVTAALLSQKGHQVIGMTCKLWTPSPWKCGEREGICCSPQDVGEAKQVCRQLGIPHYTVDMEKRFKEMVVDDFIREYARGRTPNPCVRCNLYVKFDTLMKYALALDADLLATGHYARIERRKLAGSRESWSLLRSRDQAKDQSYFLYMLGQEQLGKLLFPLGSYRKTQVKGLAKKMGLATARKRESQDVCFLEGRSVKEFLDEHIPKEKQSRGLIVNKEGKILGEHNGLHSYTVGQREKLGVAMGKPYYVLEKDQERNRLIIGPREEVFSSGCELESPNWCSGAAPERPIPVKVKIRYRHPGTHAIIKATSASRVEVRFRAQQASVTPGQSAVFYQGDRVIGGGIINESRNF